MADVEAAAPVVTFKKRGGNKNIRKRPATPPPDDSDSEYSSEDQATGQRIKRRRKGGIAAGSSQAARATDTKELKASEYAADTSSTINTTNDATKQSNWFEEGDSSALSAETLLGRKNASAPAAAADGTYKGRAGYSNFSSKPADASDRKVGPVKAPTNIRTITVTDYAPDVCKDYKQTGFCGFGDSCKFLHAREDYKQGWQLDRDWDVGGKGKTQSGTVTSSARRGDPASTDRAAADAEALDKIPFACVICKQPYRNPIVTKCQHYFCEKCALDRYKKNPTCAICAAGTGGVFNGAKNLKKLLAEKKERAKRLKTEKREAGEEVSSSDDDDDGDGD